MQRKWYIYVKISIAVLIIRPANQSDLPMIMNILKVIDLYYPNYRTDSFWVAEMNNNIVGVVRIEEHPDFALIESLGILPQYQKQDIARQLLEESTKDLNKDLYLYTIIPEYFCKLDFNPLPPPSFIPSKDRYDCDDCQPKKCVCMIRKAQHAA